MTNGILESVLDGNTSFNLSRFDNQRGRSLLNLFSGFFLIIMVGFSTWHIKKRNCA